MAYNITLKKKQDAYYASYASFSLQEQAIQNNAK